ncbi:hypothetical protein ACFL9U_08815 [Thermodesulfobacteriota bacterium]
MSDVLIPEQVDERLVEEAVNFINGKVAETVFKGSLEIGEYVLKTFFNDDIEFASSRNRYKSMSYRALCERRDLAVNYSTLTKMVRVAAQERFLMANRILTDRLTYTHRVELIKLDNNAQKLSLVEECINLSLSVRELVPLINAVRKQITQPRTTTPTAQAKKHISEIERMTDGSTLLPQLAFDLNKLKSIPQETRDHLRQTVTDLIAQIPNMTIVYNTLIDNLNQIKMGLRER